MSMKVDRVYTYNNSRHSGDNIKAVPDVDTYNKTRVLRDDEETVIYEQKKNSELTKDESEALIEGLDNTKSQNMSVNDIYEMEQFKSNINKDILFNKNKTK